jgi:methylated-DNA-[protein]-cysteine S-methyltransferase
MNHYYDTFATPLGPFSLAVNESGAVSATAFGTRAQLERRLDHCHLIGDIARTGRARAQVLEYLGAHRRTFDLPVDVTGTSFQRRVWNALRRIPYGATRSYGDIAAEIGQPASARAVGRANATNPVCLIVPCHRVIGADGSLTGFAFGEGLKRRLLELEGVLQPA